MIIYTCITNGYDVPEGHYIDPDVRYVLLHDGSVSVPDGWEGIDVRETFKCDEPVRQSYYPKINPHKFFDTGEDTVWLDGGYRITKHYVDFCREQFRQGDFTRLQHPEKCTFYEEMMEGFMCQYFTFEDVVAATKTYAEAGMNFRKYGSILCTSIWRTINDKTIAFDELYWKYYDMHYIITDQMAFHLSMQLNNYYARVITDRDSVGILGHAGKVNRRGPRPKYGIKGQQSREMELVQEMYKYTKLHPKFYYKRDYTYLMRRHGII